MSSRTTEFYIVIEFATFMDTSWDLVRGVTYLAVAKEAFEILVEYADYQIGHPGIQSISQISQPCSEHVFSESISCLRSGSPSQLFVAASSCTSLSLYSRPERKWADYTPETEVLGFRHLGRPRLPKSVETFHKLGQSVNGPNFVRRPAGLTPTQRPRLATSKEHRDRKPKDLSFVR